MDQPASLSLLNAEFRGRERGIAFETGLALLPLALGSFVASGFTAQLGQRRGPAFVVRLGIADVPVANSGQGSGTQSTTRQLGSALGIAILGTVLFGSLAARLSDRLAAGFLALGLLASLSLGRGTPPTEAGEAEATSGKARAGGSPPRRATRMGHTGAPRSIRLAGPPAPGEPPGRSGNP